MHVRFSAAGSLVLALFSSNAMAEDLWVRTTERGLPVLSLAVPAGSLRIVCDPDRIFGGSPNGSVAVDFAGDPGASTVVFLAKSGEEARFALKHGFAAQTAVSQEDWAKMVAILRKGGTFAVVSSKASLTVTAEPLPDLSCD